jgi:hypothetical protein
MFTFSTTYNAGTGGEPVKSGTLITPSYDVNPDISLGDDDG